MKFGGLSSGGTEKWLQMMAANLNKNQFEVTYFYCDAAPYIGSDFKHPTTDITRLKYLVDANVHLIKFHVEAKDVTREDHFWVGNNFWSLFDESAFDLVVTGKAGPAEYPYTEISLPIVEYVTLGVGVDQTESIKWSIHCSEWQRRRWIRMGGKSVGSSTLPIPYFDVRSDEDYRLELGIPENAFVIGMHQRADNGIFSTVPLSAFELLSDPNAYFVLLGGGSLYADQAKRLGIDNFVNLPHTAEEKLISKFLNTLNVFAHGRSDGETFGTVFAEAMSHGLPVVTHFSKDGANAQSETIGPAGKCVETIGQYAEFLEDLKSDFVLYEKLSRKAREFSKLNYSLASVSQQFEGFLLKVLDRNKSTSTEITFGFGRSPLGFLQYGELNNTSSIAHHIVQGVYPEEYDLLISNIFLKKSRVFYDVGSKEGLFSLQGAQINSSVDIHCFENQQEYIDQLKQSIYLNNWEDRVTIHNFASFAEDEGPELGLDGSNSAKILKAIDDAESRSKGFQTLILDSLYLELPDLIKIDVAGRENSFLIGATKSISTSNPVLLLKLANGVEFNAYFNPGYALVLKQLCKLKYSVYKSDGKGTLRRVRKNKPHDGILMYLCLPKGYPALGLFKIRLQLFRSRTRNQINVKYRCLRSLVVRLVRLIGI